MKKGFLLLMMCALPLLGFAQSDDFGTILSVEADKKITKPLHVGFEAEMRTRDHVKAVDRWSGGVSISYKLLSDFAGFSLNGLFEINRLTHICQTEFRFITYCGSV